MSETGSGAGIKGLLHVKDLLNLSIADTLVCILGWAEVYASMYHLAYREEDGRVVTDQTAFR